MDAAHTGIIGLYKAFWRHAAGNRPLVAVFLVLLFLAQAVRLAIPFFFGEAVNSLQASGAQDIALAGWNMALMFGACVLAWAMHGPGRVLERFMAIRIREKFADMLYARAVSLPLRWHESHHSGETIQRMAKATHALFGFSQNQFIYLQNGVSLVGPLGSGKSTLLRILAGLYEADRIAIGIDDAPRPDLRDLAPLATLVPQDPEVFEGTLTQNITMGIAWDAQEVDRACELACLAPVIARLPAGLETGITERGLNMSGGQKQRLALARGILASRDSSLIMLDEPTSSMDPTTEARIYDNLLAEFPDACIVSSVHRLHLLNRFDTIVWMADGKVIDTGSLADLLARQQNFQTLWQNYAGSHSGETGSDRDGLVLAA